MKNQLLIIFLLFFSVSVTALTIDQISTPQDFVGDFAGVLSPTQVQSLENKVKEINQQTSVEIGIAIIGSADGRPVSDLAFEIGNKWKIGKKDVFNGVLILIAVDDRKWFIATAKGVEGTLPDIIVNRIGEENFSENFKQNDYFTGILSALNEIQGFVEKDKTIVSKYTTNYSSRLAESRPPSIISIIINFIWVSVFLYAIFSRKGRRRFGFLPFIMLGAGMGRYRGGGFGGGFGGGGGFSGGGAGGGW